MTKIPGANKARAKVICPVQLTASKIGYQTRSMSYLLYAIRVPWKKDPVPCVALEEASAEGSPKPRKQYGKNSNSKVRGGAGEG